MLLRFTPLYFLLLCLATQAFAANPRPDVETHINAMVFTSEEKEAFPYVVRYTEKISKYEKGTRDQIRITEIRGTAPEFKIGEEYLVVGSFSCSDPERVFIFFGVERGRERDVKNPGYSRWHNPKRAITQFKLGMKIKGKGRVMLTVFERGTNKWVLADWLGEAAPRD